MSISRPRYCPNCQSLLDWHTVQATGDVWWFCTNYPVCRWQRPVEEGASTW